MKFIGSNAPRNASIDLATAKARGIPVSATGYTSHGAMEMTWALIHAAARHVPAEVASFRSGGWQVGVGGDLKGSTLGVMGLGNIGRAIARVGLAFEMDVIAWSENLTQEAATRRWRASGGQGDAAAGGGLPDAAYGAVQAQPRHCRR